MRLLSPRSYVTRPITDRVKESLFNVLANVGLPQDKLVADVFSGVGSIGLEALSRGARSVTFVDKTDRVVRILKTNIEKAGYSDRASVIQSNAFEVGAPLESGQEKYDLVFVDPPYAKTRDIAGGSRLEKLLYIIAEQIQPDGVVVVRTHRSSPLLESYGLLKVSSRRNWGTMNITFLKLSRDDK